MLMVSVSGTAVKTRADKALLWLVDARVAVNELRGEKLSIKRDISDTRHRAQAAYRALKSR